MIGRAVAAGLAVLVASAAPASAGFLPPSAWQSAGHASEEVLAIRAAVGDAVGQSQGDHDGLLENERAALAAFYEQRSHATLWVSVDGLSSRGEDLVTVLRDAGSHALPVSAYAFAIDAADALAAGGDIAARARAETLLSSAALIYARHATSGQVAPRSISTMVSAVPEPADPAAVLDALAVAGDVAAVLEGYHPQTDDYRALRAAFRSLAARLGRDERIVVPAGGLLKPAMSGARVALLRSRLIETGDLAAGSGGATVDVFDDDLVAAVKAFQVRHGLADDGVVGPGTLEALNTPLDERLRQIAVNMERRRWLPRSLGARHVLVNEAAFTARVVDNGEIIHEARVIVGKPQHQTPEFSDEIQFVVFNPYWNVPESIATNEYLPYLRQNPMALSNMGIEFFARDGAVSTAIDPRDVDWSTVGTENFPYRLRQPPMSGNALGRVKFLFPNHHAVYMHDTPSRGLFSNRTRAFSHGCVRVQNPVDLAEILLAADGWSRGAIDRAIATGANQHIRLTKSVPVHLAYWTAWADPSGALHFAEDIYGRDARLADALGISGDAMKLADLATN